MYWNDEDWELFEALEGKLLKEGKEIAEDDLNKYLTLLEELRNYECAGEVDHVNLLAQNDEVEPNIFNTYEWLKNCLERLDDNLHKPLLADEFPSAPLSEWKMSRFHPGYLHIIDDYDRGFEAFDGLKKYFPHQFNEHNEYREDYEIPKFQKTPIYLSPIEEFVASVRCGYIPSPAHIISIARAFDLYFSAGGQFTLEEAFFGKHKQKDIRAKRKSHFFSGISFQVFDDSVNRSPDFILKDLVLRFFESFNEANPDNRKLIPEQIPAFLKKYRRWKSANGFKTRDKGQKS